MKEHRVLSGLLVCAAVWAVPVSAIAQSELVGEWCFYEQEGAGSKVPEKVDIALRADRSYLWKEGAFEQKGTWSVKDKVLDMTDVGAHQLLRVDADSMEIRRGSTMRLKRGKCSAAVFGDQDIIRLQNAASTGDMVTLQAALGTGIAVDIVDFRSGDTALIKAAKFCQVPAATLLLARGADKAIKNDDGKTAADYAQSSRFHKGCDALTNAIK